MEKHRCKLCYRKFANGKALGGHMRSHMMNLYAASKAKQELIKEEHEENINDHRQFGEDFESVTSSSSSEEEDDDEEINPKREICKMVDQEFCFEGVEVAPAAAAAAAPDSVVVQDGESETESSKNPICRRSKRVKKSRISDTLQFCGYIDNGMMKEPKVLQISKKPENFVEAEPVSSISETTPEEDVAYCLMMLSRDKWKKEDNEEEEEEKEKKYCQEFGVVKVTKSRTRGKYRCETCKKVFRSYQALGGHRASHKRIKALISNSTEEEETTGVEIGNATASVVVEEKIHECPFCYRVFSSGQALGGHKRSHFMGANHVSISPSPAAAKPFSRFRANFIDLNLPAPVDDDEEDISQIELSAVSDAELVNPLEH